MTGKKSRVFRHCVGLRRAKFPGRLTIGMAGGIQGILYVWKYPSPLLSYYEDRI